MTARTIGIRLVTFLLAAGVLIGVASRYFAFRGVEVGHSGLHRGIIPMDLEIGSKVCFPYVGGIDSAPRAPRSLVIVTGLGCPACSANALIEERIYQRARSLGILVIYLVDDVPNQDPRASALRDGGRVVVRANLAGVGLSRTPTMAAIDPSGTIIAMAVGVLQGERAEKAIVTLLEGRSAPPYSRIPPTGDSDVLSGATQVLTFRRPQGGPLLQSNYRVMEERDAAIRAKVEFDRARPLVVNCEPESIHPFMCQGILIALADSGFQGLKAVGLPFRAESEFCQSRPRHD
jgi:hypothetical protein